MESSEDVKREIRVLNGSIQRLTDAVEQLTTVMQMRESPAPPRRRMNFEILAGALFFVGLLIGAAYLLISVKH